MTRTATASVLAFGLVLFAAACGSATSGSAATVTPDTALTDSALLDTSWISPADGWALAAQPCATGSCARLARTTDGGRHWQPLPDPPAVIEGQPGLDCPPQVCVGQVSFATPTIGYLYGPALLMTTDGGLTWHGQPGLQTETLTIIGGQVYRVTFTSDGCPGPCQPSLQEAPTGAASWRTVIGQLGEPDRSDSAQIAASGPDALLALYGGIASPFPGQADVYRSTDGGGSWRQAADPCGGLGLRAPKQEDDLIGLAAAPGGFFVGLCASPSASGTLVITSADAGATWQPTATQPHGRWPTVVAAASPGTITIASGAVGGNGGFTAALLVTTDEGKHWATAATDAQNLAAGSAPAQLSFESPLAGQWLGDPHGVWTTTDGGLHWARTAFR